MNLTQTSKRILLSSLLALPLSLHAFAEPAKSWPAPIKALEKQGYEILGSFKAPDGMTGYTAMLLTRPQTIYLTPGGDKAIVGTMIDANGDNWNQQLLDKQFSTALWQQLEHSAWVADGDSKAPRVIYAFTDPNCPYCSKFWNDARPWVKAGKVQIRHILVGIIKADSTGKAAAILADANPSAALNRHELQHASGGVKPLSKIPQPIQDKLSINQKLMERFGAFATPTILYRDASGTMQRMQGAPSSAAKLKEVMEGK
ncbi:thiol:disulfide interchange protein DsbG [Jeongeupia wiesaeckerbachi]|uniref:thiol:disulfide interchange protein DsbG n=1 Tax=Jeongeupia wiesaeckerbachi TaxID=3051218 RepID=UPI003D803323